MLFQLKGNDGGTRSILWLSLIFSWIFDWFLILRWTSSESNFVCSRFCSTLRIDGSETCWQFSVLGFAVSWFLQKKGRNWSLFSWCLHSGHVWRLNGNARKGVFSYSCFFAVLHFIFCYFVTFEVCKNLGCQYICFVGSWLRKQMTELETFCILFSFRTEHVCCVGIETPGSNFPVLFCFLQFSYF